MSSRLYENQKNISFHLAIFIFLVKIDQKFEFIFIWLLCFAESGCNIILPSLQSSDNCDKLFSLVIDAPEQESLTEGEAQYSRPPCIENFIRLFFTKQTTLMKGSSVLSLASQLEFPG